MLRQRFGQHFTLFRRGTIGHVNEYPTMHYFGNPGRTWSMVAQVFLEIPVKNCLVGMLLLCPIDKMYRENLIIVRKSMDM